MVRILLRFVGRGDMKGIFPKPNTSQTYMDTS